MFNYISQFETKACIRYNNQRWYSKWIDYKRELLSTVLTSTVACESKKNGRIWQYKWIILITLPFKYIAYFDTYLTNTTYLTCTWRMNCCDKSSI